MNQALIERARQLYAQNPDVGRYRLAKELRVGENAARRIINEIRSVSRKTAACEAPEKTEEHEIKGDEWNVTLHRTRICTLEQLLDYCKVDTDTWAVERWTCNKWEVGAKTDSGIVVEPLFQVKAWLRKKKEQAFAKAEIEAMMDDAKRYMPKVPEILRKRHDSGNMLEISISDHHMGMLAWGRETGWESYDTKIAERLFMEALSALIERTAMHKFDQVSFVIGNDLMNVDNMEGTTTRGTKQDVDSRYHKVFRVTRDMKVRAVEQLRKVAPVKVIVVPGNHDRLATFHIGDSLECWFHNYKDVEVDNSPRSRKYVQFGKVMLMFCHGDEGRRHDYPLLMATEEKRMFGETLFHEIHTGDKHQTRVEEQHGIRVRILPTLCPPSAWAAASGYIGNIRSAEAFVWNREEGLVGTALYTIPNRRHSSREAA